MHVRFVISMYLITSFFFFNHRHVFCYSGWCPSLASILEKRCVLLWGFFLFYSFRHVWETGSDLRRYSNVFASISNNVYFVAQCFLFFCVLSLFGYCFTYVFIVIMRFVPSQTKCLQLKRMITRSNLKKKKKCIFETNECDLVIIIFYNLDENRLGLVKKMKLRNNDDGQRQRWKQLRNNNV